MAHYGLEQFPEDCDTAPDGGTWQLYRGIDGLECEFQSNPRQLVGEGEWVVVQLWQAYRGGGMGGGHLPEAGGMLQQPAALMDAFALMNSCAKALTDQESEARRGRR